MDLAVAKSVEGYVEAARPRIVIHAGALTGIAVCEREKELAWKTNVEGTKALVSACRRYADECLFVYVSTACVFQGDRGMYVETDLPYPKNYYSLTKLLGEIVVRESDVSQKLIVRTNFASRDPWPYPRAFVDRFGTYLFSDDVATGIKELVASGRRGAVHLVGNRKISVFELARMTRPEVLPMTLAEYVGPPLTVDMSLDSVVWKKYKLGFAAAEVEAQAPGTEDVGQTLGATSRSI